LTTYLIVEATLEHLGCHGGETATGLDVSAEAECISVCGESPTHTFADLQLILGERRRVRRCLCQSGLISVMVLSPD